MAALLKIEWQKIRKYRMFMLMLAFYLVSIVGLNYIVYNITADRLAGSGAEVAAQIMIGRPFAFPEVWQTVSYLSSFLLLIPGLVVILLMGNEYSFRTGRQNIIDGVSRGQFIDTKIALIFIMALALTIVVFLTGLLFGITGGGAFSLGGIEYLGYFFVNAVSYMSVALVIVLLLKRSAVSIGIYFLYGFIIENMLALIISKKIWAGAGSLLPLESSDKLIPMPTMLGKAFNPTEIGHWYLFGAACVWIAVCLAFCRYRFKKRDL